MDEVVQKLPFIPVAAPSITERKGELAQEAGFTLGAPAIMRSMRGLSG